LNQIDPLRLAIDALTSDEPAPLTVDVINNFLHKICDKPVVVVMICALTLPKQKTRFDLIPHIREMAKQLGSVVHEWWTIAESIFADLVLVEGKKLSESAEKVASMINLMNVDQNGAFYFAVSNICLKFLPISARSKVNRKR
jgi:hypothetical protein